MRLHLRGELGDLCVGEVNQIVLMIDPCVEKSSSCPGTIALVLNPEQIKN
jgi:hypothetical protein